MDQHEFIIRVLFGSIVVFLYLSQLERFLTMIFVLNFSTAGPNLTVVLIFLLLTGVVELVLPWPHTNKVLSISLVSAALMVLASFLPNPVLVTFASILSMMFITPLLVNRVQLLKEQFTLCVIVGVLIQITTRVWLDTASYCATIFGIIILLLWIGLGVLLWFIKIKNDPIPPSQQTLVGLAPVIGFILIQLLFLGFPNVVSTWFFRHYFIISVVGAIGLSFGAILVFEKGEQILQDKWIFGWIALFLLSLTDLLWINLLSFITYFVAQVSGCVILYAGMKKNTIKSPKVIGIRLAITQLLMVFTLFLHVSAGNWAFMPSLLAFTRGHAATTIFIAGLFLPLSCLKLEFPKLELKQPQNVKNSIRLVFLIVVVVSTAGIITNDFLGPKKSPDSDKLKIMTFNIHQYFSIGQTGLYNLEQVRDVILASGADVVGLQESEGARISSSNMNGLQWLAHQTGMGYYYGPPTSAQIYGVSLLSKFPILDAQYKNLPAEQSIERVAIVVEIDTGTLTGRLPIVVTHLQTNKYSEDRLAQSQSIVSITQGFSRAVVLGDFNTHQNNTDPAFALLNATFSDTWLLAGNAPNGGTSYSSSGIATNRIDYIWLKGSWTVLNCLTFGSPRTSDHRAVYAELVVS